MSDGAKDLFLEEFGGSGEALVLVHGLGGSTNTWFPQAQVLKRDLRVIAYDLAGSARSPVRDGISIDSHVEDLLAVIAQSGAARVHLAGHSLGTIVCQHAAARHPDKIASLALVGPFPQPPEPARAALRDRAAKVRAEGMRGIADAIVTGGTSTDTRTHQPAAAAFVRESILAQPAEGYARNCEALAAARSADLARITCPVLLVTGDQDRTAPPDTGRAMASAVHGAELQVLEGCGHWATIERAKQVNYALTVFLARQRRRAAA
ncbi:MAG TPA: alpha/beta fold hydrolase [Acetobacteraceae bacterium]|nr:alpha/beta fold hydrolase [Acetobacteraceae bacterium]